MMRHVCFVTDELHPFTVGGIGRLLHNVIRHGQELTDDVAFHLLIPDRAGIDARAVTAAFGDRVQAHVAPMRAGPEPSIEFGDVYPPASAFTDTPWHAQSLDLMLALKRLAAEGLSFDVVEFPDFKGWAYCTLQEKHLGLGFQDTLVAVRLHTTDGILQRFEPRGPTLEQAASCELERKALHDADLVVAHLPSIPEFNRDHYGFDEAWASRVVIEFPPVVWGSEARTRPVDGGRNLLFATKLQAIKRPDVFVRGAAQFLRDTPDYEGGVLVACHAVDAAYAERIRGLVPPDLAHRFRFLAPGSDRDELIAHSILVIPSAYESCNLTAYEASQAGAALVLNRGCPAFDERSPFRDGVNCHKFDGTVEGLAAVLGEARAGRELAPVAWSAGRPYWLDPAARLPARRWPGRSDARVSVVITNFNLAQFLPRAIASARASTHRDIEIIVVDDASTSRHDAEVLDRLESEPASQCTPIRIIRNGVNRGLPGARNVGIRVATGRYVLPLDADDAVSPKFIEVAARALDACPEFDVAVPGVGHFRMDDELAARQFVGYSLFLGDAPSLGLVANRLSCASALLRRSLFERFAYDEALDSYEDWDLYLRLVHAGHRFLVTNGVHLHYRSRPGSMVSAMTGDRHFRLLARMAEKVPSGARGLRLFPLVAQAAEERPFAQPLPLRYKLADAVDGVLKRGLPFLKPALRRTASAARRLAGKDRDGG